MVDTFDQLPMTFYFDKILVRSNIPKIGWILPDRCSPDHDTTQGRRSRPTTPWPLPACDARDMGPDMGMPWGAGRSGNGGFNHQAWDLNAWYVVQVVFCLMFLRIYKQFGI